MLPPPPPVLLILGTDAAGKDYVADFLICRWQAAGDVVEKRAGRGLTADYFTKLSGSFSQSDGLGASCRRLTPQSG
jgi:hypothetical protein